MRSYSALGAAVVAAALVTSWAEAARADRVAMVPSRSSDETARGALDIELARSLIALGHAVVPEAETKTALAGIGDGVADTSEEYQAVAAATKADWVLAGTVEPAVGTQRVELVALLASLGRVELVAREVEKARSQAQTQEMLAVLLRAEGIGAGLLPWEQVAKPLPKPVAQPPKEVAAPPPVQPSGKKVVHMDYLFDRQDVWPAYAANRRFFLSVGQGFSVAAAQPEGAVGGAAAYVGQIRAGYALGDDGLELLGQLGGNLFGPRALWIEGGARWMFTPSLHVQPPSGDYYALSFHMGPELTLGGLVRLPAEVDGGGGATYEGSAQGHFTLGAALDLILAITPAFRVEAQVGNFRWVPTGDGSVVLFGATLGAGLRL
ncbi:MAG: hypothetical protein WKG00_30245 [Polyangiaceae bacterium]